MAIRKSNIFVSLPGVVKEIFLYGLRNPFRFGFGVPLDELIIGDVGQNNVEEINRGVAGKNYGWNKKEDNFLFSPDDGTTLPEPSRDRRLIEPLAEYSHFGGIAVIGGYIYRGSLAPALRGRYVFGDLFGSTAGPGYFSLICSRERSSSFRPVIQILWQKLS